MNHIQKQLSQHKILMIICLLQLHHGFLFQEKFHSIISNKLLHFMLSASPICVFLLVISEAFNVMIIVCVQHEFLFTHFCLSSLFCYNILNILLFPSRNFRQSVWISKNEVRNRLSKGNTG